jgi:hypothetical protein
MCIIYIQRRRRDKFAGIKAMSRSMNINQRNRIVSFRVSDALYNTYKSNPDQSYVSNPAIIPATSITFPDYVVDIEDPNDAFSTSNNNNLENSRESVIGTRIKQFGNVVRRNSLFNFVMSPKSNSSGSPNTFDESDTASPSGGLFSSAHSNFQDPVEYSLSSDPTNNFDPSGATDEFTRPSEWAIPETLVSEKKKKKSKWFIS